MSNETEQGLRPLWVFFLCSLIYVASSCAQTTDSTQGNDKPATTPLDSASQVRQLTPLGGQDPRLDSIVRPWLGTPHRRGKNTRQGTDCSGFVQNILQDYLEFTTPRTSANAFRSGDSVLKENLLPGDVVFFRKQGRIYHSGVWIGNGRFAHASTTYGVIVTELDQDAYWSSHYAGARRFLPNPAFAPHLEDTAAAQSSPPLQDSIP
ncbi:MAG TPA: NlpC/P60 family protein [Fibrobacteraceae bacterium]|nr:NlpC/P60 family protein [Fibrobacteraceae bacterium]